MAGLGTGNKETRKAQGWERGLISPVSFLLQGVPGHNGLPGQPGLTAELVGISQDTLAIVIPVFLGAELTMQPGAEPFSSGGGSSLAPDLQAGCSSGLNKPPLPDQL